MDKTIHVEGHGLVHAYRHTGNWRAQIGNVQYVSQTWGGLVNCLGSINSLHVHTPEPPRVFDPPAIRCAKILRDHESSLDTKQAAWFEIQNLDEPEALEITKQIKAKGRPSFHANSFTRKIGKADFHEVTSAELLQHEHDVVRRSALIKELAERFQCK